MRPQIVALAIACLCAAVSLSAVAADKAAPKGTAASSSASPSASASAPPSALPTAAPASDPSAPEATDSLYNQGNEAYDRGDLQLAFELYTGAFKLRKSYDIARNLGLVELKLGRFRDAIEHLTYSLSLYPSNRADTKKQVIEWLDQAKSQVGKLHLSVSPESADCRVAGASVNAEQREDDILVDPGAVKIECRAKGYRVEKRTISIEKGGRADETIRLTQDGSQPASAQPSLGPRTVLIWSGSAAAAAGLGVGAAMGIVSLVKAGEADRMRETLVTGTGRTSPCTAPKADGCEELYALRREQDAFGNAAFWMLIAGGVAGAGTVAYGLIVRPPNSTSGGAVVVPVIGNGTGGLLFQGSF